MERTEVVKRLCALVTRVGAERYGHKLAHDCFCPEGERYYVGIDTQIIQFVEDAVEHALYEHAQDD